jgi:hypothetical protein
VGGTAQSTTKTPKVREAGSVSQGEAAVAVLA